MFIELIDALRCPVVHEESWLVLAAERTVARHVLDGTLGCPVCHAAWPIAEGVVDLRHGDGEAPTEEAPRGEEWPMRLAAFLGLGDAGGFALLAGGWGAHALALRSLVEAPLVLVDPPADVEPAPGLSLIRTSGTLPLALGAARATAIDLPDSRNDAAERVASLVRATRVAGRLIGPASLPLPSGVAEIARDADLWVGERQAPPAPLLRLHVRRGQ